MALKIINDNQSETTENKPKPSKTSKNKKLEIFSDSETDQTNNDSNNLLDKLALTSESLNNQIYLQKDQDDLKISIKEETSKFTLPSGQQIEKEKTLPPDLTILDQRIKDIIQILSDFKNLRKNLESHSRKHYLNQLISDLSVYYEYSRELIQIFLNLFNPNECLAFLESNEQNRPLTIRTNTLKTRRKNLAQSLINRGINLDPVGEWTDVGLKIIESQVPIGATPDYLSGHYILQSASSFIPVIALNPKPKERIIDLCAAPGGKTTHIAALMQNSGSLVANDINKLRLKSLIANIHRLGVYNCIVSNVDGRNITKHFSYVDRVLLDAPCSGLGVISRDNSIKMHKTQNDINKCSFTQKELILSAIDAVKPDSGVVVYSTCSISVEENECVVNYALKKRYVKCVPFDIDFGVSGLVRYRKNRFHVSIKNAKRYYPHVHNMDGFFVAKLVKYKNGVKNVIEEKDQTGNEGLDDQDDLENVIPKRKSGGNKKGDNKKKKMKKTKF